jgi:hypothetical protein
MARRRVVGSRGASTFKEDLKRLFGIGDKE